MAPAAMGSRIIRTGIPIMTRVTTATTIPITTAIAAMTVMITMAMMQMTIKFQKNFQLTPVFKIYFRNL